jgi:hypothetical protein
MEQQEIGTQDILTDKQIALGRLYELYLRGRNRVLVYHSKYLIHDGIRQANEYGLFVREWIKDWEDRKDIVCYLRFPTNPHFGKGKLLNSSMEEDGMTLEYAADLIDKYFYELGEKWHVD